MKKISTQAIVTNCFLLLLIGCTLLMSSCSPTLGGGVALIPNTKNYAVPMKNILDTIQEQYSLAMEWLKNEKGNLPIKLQEADVSFDATNNVTADGNFSVLVAKADFNTTLNGESTVTFVLAEDTPKVQALTKAKKDDKNNPWNKLALTIYNAALTFNSLNSTYIDKTTPQSFEIDITYSITYNGTISVSITPAPVGGGGSVEGSHQTKHIIKLKFARKTP